MRTIASLRPFPMRVGNFVGNTIEKAAVLPISIPPRKKYLVYSLFTRGEGGPAKPGRMRGRFGTQPFLVEKGVTDSRPDRLLLLPRWATRSPPHPSPSVTASPQGEASGLCSPIRKKRPKSGHVHGPRNSLTTTPLRSTTPKPASGNERAIKKGGPGGKAPGALSSGFLRRKPGSRPESGGNPRRRSGPATVPTEPPADHRPPPSPGEFPRPQAGKESAIMF